VLFDWKTKTIEPTDEKCNPVDVPKPIVEEDPPVVKKQVISAHPELSVPLIEHLSRPVDTSSTVFCTVAACRSDQLDFSAAATIVTTR
jgi:hypothetical protein